MDFTGKINKSDIDAIIAKLTQLYDTYRSPNVEEEINSSYQPPSSVTVGNNITIQDLNSMHSHYQTKIGNGANAALWSAGGPAQYKVILDDEFEQLYSAIEQINFISQQPCYVCDLDVCECDVSVFEWSGCTCEEACDTGYSCDCDDSCDGYACGCYDTCYTYVCECDVPGDILCTCDYSCDSYSSCTCNSTCDSGYSCSCFSSCDPDSCTCEFSYYTCNQCYGSNYVCSVSY